MAVLYQDRHLVLDDEAITIVGYHSPISSKRIPYREIRGVQERRMGLLTGRLMLWGTPNLRQWLNLDPSRPRPSPGGPRSSA